MATGDAAGHYTELLMEVMELLRELGLGVWLGHHLQEMIIKKILVMGKDHALELAI